MGFEQSRRHLIRPGRFPSFYSPQLCSNLVCFDDRREGGLIAFASPWEGMHPRVVADWWLLVEWSHIICGHSIGEG